MRITVTIDYDDETMMAITREFGNEVTLDSVLEFLKTVIDTVMGWSFGHLEYVDDMVESDEKEK